MTTPDDDMPMPTPDDEAPMPEAPMPEMPEPEMTEAPMAEMPEPPVTETPTTQIAEVPTDEGFPHAPVSDESRRAIEAVVLASTEPVEPRFLAQLVELPVADVEQLCADLAREYEEQRRGFVLLRVNGGYRFQTHPDLAPYVERFVLEGQHVRLSGPALETLAIVAYKQPISRGQISAIRGVNVETTLTTLVQRGYVEEVDRDPGPGLAVLYGTTATFLERLGIDSIHDLPPLGDFVPEASIVEALERGLRISQDPTDPDRPDDDA